MYVSYRAAHIHIYTLYIYHYPNMKVEFNPTLYIVETPAMDHTNNTQQSVYIKQYFETHTNVNSTIVFFFHEIFVCV